MTRPKTTWASAALTAALLSTPTAALAQSAPPREEPARRVFIETQPLALAFGGFSLGAQYQHDHLRVGGGVYAFTFPEFFTEQTAGNAGEGWGVAVQPAGWIEGNWTLEAGGAGLGLGANLVLSNIRVERQGGEGEYLTLMLVPKVSYTWIVFEYGFITPFLGAEFHLPLTDAPVVAGEAFERLSIQPLPGLSLGVTF